MSPEDFLENLRRAVHRYDLFAPGQTVVVAVSGGPDSTALLHSLSHCKTEWNIRLVAAHLNHGFRGEEAEADAGWAEALASTLEVPFRSEKQDVPARGRRRHLSAQQAAREARHDFLRRVAAETGAARIALGHTADDRIETALLNLLRGTGLEGLSGFPPACFPLVRPLYALRRSDIEVYCQQRHLQSRHDSSNTSLHYRRNRIRAELLPHLKTYYNEGAEEAILRMTALAFADNEVLEQLAEETLERLCVARTSVLRSWRVTDFNGLLPGLRRRVLRRAIEEVRGGLENVSFAMLETLVEAAAQNLTCSLTLPSRQGESVRLWCDRGLLNAARESVASSFLPWQKTLTLPGKTEIPSLSVVIETQWKTSYAEAAQWQRQAATETAASGKEVWRCVFRQEDISLPLMARSWQPGDSIRWREKAGSKKLQDLFVDAKIPSSRRHAVPVLVDAGGAGEVLAVAGLRANVRALRGESAGTEAAVPMGSTGHLLCVEFITGQSGKEA